MERTLFAYELHEKVNHKITYFSTVQQSSLSPKPHSFSMSKIQALFIFRYNCNTFNVIQFECDPPEVSEVEHGAMWVKLS